MKKKLSISVDEGKVDVIEGLVQSGRFRNKSHMIEYAIDKFLGDL